MIPERSKVPLREGVPSTWGAFGAELAALRSRWRERQGEGLRILTGATTSPTLIRQMAELAKQFPKMRWHRFEPVGSARQDEAMKLAFGRAVTPHYRLDQCDVIVSLGSRSARARAASGACMPPPGPARAARSRRARAAHGCMSRKACRA